MAHDAFGRAEESFELDGVVLVMAIGANVGSESERLESGTSSISSLDEGASAKSTNDGGIIETRGSSRGIGGGRRDGGGRMAGGAGMRDDAGVALGFNDARVSGGGSDGGGDDGFFSWTCVISSETEI